MHLRGNQGSNVDTTVTVVAAATVVVVIAAVVAVVVAVVVVGSNRAETIACYAMPNRFRVLCL